MSPPAINVTVDVELSDMLFLLSLVLLELWGADAGRFKHLAYGCHFRFHHGR